MPAIKCAPLAAGLLVLFAASAAAAQEIRVVRCNPNGSCNVTIDGKPFLAITPEMARASLDSVNNLQTVRGTLAARERERAAFSETLRTANASIAAKDSLIAGLEKQLRTTEEMISIYKKLSAPTLTIEGALGSNVNGNPGILAGVGIKRVRVFGLLQKDNAGGFIGASMRVF
jgi:hypothetical protein